ncbi:MAG: MarC family protein [Candidatus Ranarchaeia archaeon]
MEGDGIVDMQVEQAMQLLFYILTDSVSLLVIINPLVNAAVFQEMVPDSRQRQKAVNTAVRIALIVLFIFGIAGGWALLIMGISIAAFQVAGGFLLLRLSLSLLSGEEVKMKSEDVAVVPMAVPLIAGPGAISTTIVMTYTSGILSTLCAIGLASLFSWFIMSEADRLIYRIGRRGLLAFGRIMAMLIAALAVQFIFTGIAAFYATL